MSTSCVVGILENLGQEPWVLCPFFATTGIRLCFTSPLAKAGSKKLKFIWLWTGILLGWEFVAIITLFVGSRDCQEEGDYDDNVASGLGVLTMMIFYAEIFLQLTEFIIDAIVANQVELDAAREDLRIIDSDSSPA